MNKIDKNELYQHLSGFLKTKGVELKEGSYSRRIEKGCGLLADTINLSQQALTRTKEELDRRLDQMRQVIHEKTAPKPAASEAQPGPAPGPGPAAPAKKSSRKAAAGKGAASRRQGRR